MTYRGLGYALNAKAAQNRQREKAHPGAPGPTLGEGALGRGLQPHGIEGRRVQGD